MFPNPTCKIFRENSLLIHTQCGKYRIFLSLRFYVKSIFRDSKSAKSAILSQRDALNFDSYAFMQFWKAENYQINNIQSLWNCKKRQFLNFWVLQNWFHVKSQWQKNPDIYTLCREAFLEFTWNHPQAFYVLLGREMVN